MKTEINYYSDEFHGDYYRDIKKFFIFPKTINGKTRWLEVAKYTQRWHSASEYSGWATSEWREDDLKEERLKKLNKIKKSKIWKF